MTENKDALLKRIILEKLPQHIAVIMDGNGRWAKQKGHERFYGHIKGVESVRKITESCAKLKIPFLTLYAFSTENWNRPQEEINHLMELLAESIEKEFETLNKNNVRLHIIGDTTKLPIKTQEKIHKVLEGTISNTGLNLIMALNYSSTWEIINAINLIGKDIEDKKITLPINKPLFENYLTTKNFPNPELLIRTGGEQRISNFLLYQLAYAELYFTDVFWPDFEETTLYNAIIDFQKRERRFGKTSEQIS